MTKQELNQITFERIQFQIEECDLRIKMDLQTASKTEQGRRECFAREMGRRSGLLEAARILGFKDSDFKAVVWNGENIKEVQANNS